MELAGLSAIWVSLEYTLWKQCIECFNALDDPIECPCQSREEPQVARGDRAPFQLPVSTPLYADLVHCPSDTSALDRRRITYFIINMLQRSTTSIARAALARGVRLAPARASVAGYKTLKDSPQYSAKATSQGSRANGLSKLDVGTYCIVLTPQNSLISLLYVYRKAP